MLLKESFKSLFEHPSLFLSLVRAIYSIFRGGVEGIYVQMRFMVITYLYLLKIPRVLATLYIMSFSDSEYV